MMLESLQTARSLRAIRITSLLAVTYRVKFPDKHIPTIANELRVHQVERKLPRLFSTYADIIVAYAGIAAIQMFE